MGVFILLTTWKRGRYILSQRLDEQVKPLSVFMQKLADDPPPRVPGTAIFLYRGGSSTPYSLAQNLKTNKVLHERVILLAVKTVETPRLKRSQRASLTSLGHGVYQVVLKFGFMEQPNVPRALHTLWPEGNDIRLTDVTYFIGRETVFASEHPGMQLWREKLFAIMARNALGASTFYHLPAGHVVELGTQVEL